MKVFHGKIISLDRVNSLYEYLVEEGGRIVYVGDSLPHDYGGVKEIIELGSRVLIPSFGDGHLHFSNWAMFAIAYFDVREAGDISGIQNIIRQNLKKKKYKAIIAFGISKHRLKEKRLITREELDEVCSHIPLTIVCYDGHSAVCNSKMMERFPEEIQSLNGFHNANGHLFHEAFQEGTDYITKLVPPITLIKSIISAYDLLAEKGIGMIHATEGVGFPGDLDITLVSMIAKAQAERNNFQTRLFFQTLEVGKALKRKLPRIGGCFATAVDGCLGLCDAALHKPYTNNPQNKGIFFQDEYEVFNFIKNANRAGLQVEMHAIGDAAVSRAVNGIEAALM
ncbi:MAG: amidohydrolase family protein, partial [Spirochaetaceae bacterium]|nr:amidohydrolase family protein [Spirochaetaceae bacterium]